MNIRSTIKPYLPRWAQYVYRKLYYFPKDFPAAVSFVVHRTKSPTTFWQRVSLVWHFYKISYKVVSPHTEHEIISISRDMLNLGNEVPGVLVEAGCFHGGSTAKFSRVAKLCNRELVVFDSFEGMPENREEHGKSIFGREHHFPKGSHAVGLEEVRYHVAHYGDISRTRFIKGFFSDTMPTFKEPVAVGCINVDLVQSTKDCIKYLFPLLSRGGFLVSQDAHFPWIIELLNDESFWRDEIKVLKPYMPGLGELKYVNIYPNE